MKLNSRKIFEVIAYIWVAAWALHLENHFFLKFCLSFMSHRSLDVQILREHVPWVWEDYCKNKQDPFLYLQYKRMFHGELLSCVPFFFSFHFSYVFFPPNVSFLVSVPWAVQLSLTLCFLSIITFHMVLYCICLSFYDLLTYFLWLTISGK